VVAGQVRWLRDRRGISQQQLADSLGWTQSQVARLETGKRSISVADLLALAWALDVAPVYLLSGSFTESGDVPIAEQLRVDPTDMRNWVRGWEPLPGSNYRRFFENVPDDEWYASRETAQQRQQAAELYERAERELAGDAIPQPGERGRRRMQLDAAKRTRKSTSGDG